ncbi:GerMN domain-containing protein [Knoellia subterranea]|uniref:GerMN domain-containing protein n=1 Tax=Knoellia subterranea KCTC 19937 TaxID=1385521 RepID=A0A0A0JLR4_9MICO|nr:GerMN domain-containing protein [Knoellia subterranea]KGN36982.1 hypothetical protein N803_16330 [Knoellia subterranea KCTC 19937]
MSTLRSARALVTVLAVVAVLVSGCTSIGRPRDVEPGLEVRGGDVEPVRAIFPTPPPQATQQQIVSGFVRAGAASDGNYEIAMSYLTPEAAKGWRPEGEIVLYSTTTAFTVTPQLPNLATLSGVIEGTISPDGRYVNAPGGAKRSVQFEFARINGEWRISNVPKEFGRWITTSDLGRLLKPYTVHYLASDRRALVPDRRWFPRDHLATRLARAQLADPPAYLQGSVRNDIPSGARLTADAVSVTDGIASVEITGRVPTDQVQRENVWAQIVSTLLQDSGIQGVTVKVEDTTLELPDVDLPVRTLDQIKFPETPTPALGRPVVRRGTGLYLLPNTSTVDQDPQKSGHVDVESAFHSLALSPDRSEMAAVDPDGQGLSRFRGTTRYEMPFYGTDVGHPAYDTRGYLWAGGRGIDDDSEMRLWAFNVTADPTQTRQSPATPIEADWLKGRKVIESKPSPNGDRVAILHTADNGKDPRIDVAGVIRGAVGRPERLSSPQRLGDALVGVTGLVWLSDLSIATLATRQGTAGPRSPWVITVDGQALSLTATPTATAITSGGGERGILVTTSDGTVLSRAGQQWVTLGKGTDVLVAGR